MTRDPNKNREIWLIENTCYEPTLSSETWYLSVQVTDTLANEIQGLHNLSMQNSKDLGKRLGVAIPTQSAFGISDFHAEREMPEGDYKKMVGYFRAEDCSEAKFARVKRPGKWHKEMNNAGEAEECEITVMYDGSPENLGRNNQQLVYMEFRLRTFTDETYYFYFNIPIQELINISL